MKREKYYFEEDSENCYDKQFFIGEMHNNGIEEMILCEAVLDKNSDYAYCRSEGEVIMKDENPCGKHCPDYSPCNGRNGKCRYLGPCYTHGKQVILNVNGEIKDYKNEI